MNAKQLLLQGIVLLKKRARSVKIAKPPCSRQVRSARMESLEKRELMANDVTAVLSNNTLIIEGTNSSDFVKVFQNCHGSISVQKNVNGKWFHVNRTPISPSDVHAIKAKMLAGNDRLDINLPQQSLRSIDIKLGTGIRDELNLNNVSVDNVTVDAVASLNSNLKINKSNIRDRLFADFGAENSDDDFTSLFSIIEQLSLEMGGGNDQCTIRNSTVRKAYVDLGTGNDNFFMSNSSLESGDIDGGTGRNTRGGIGWGSSVRFRGFVR